MSTVARTIEVSQIKGGRGGVAIEIPESLEILDVPSAKRRSGCGMFRVLTPKDGDKRVVWDASSFDQIRDAKELFNDLVAKGLVPYRVGTNGKQTSEVMDEFDPHAEEVIFLPVALVAGG